MTFLQIQETIEQIFPMIGRTQIKKDVNEVYREFCQRTEMVKTKSNITIVADTVEYTLPTDMNTLDRVVYYDSSDVILLNENTLRYMVTQNKILFLNYYYEQITEIPSAIATITYYYKKVPATLSADSSEPDIPSQFHNALIEGVLALYYYRFPSLERPTQTGMMKVRDMQAGKIAERRFQDYIVKGKMHAIGNIVTTTTPQPSASSSNYVANEALTGTKNGVNATFTIVSALIVDTESIMFNGVELLRGTAYTISGQTVTMVTYIPASTDKLTANYFKS